MYATTLGYGANTETGNSVAIGAFSVAKHSGSVVVGIAAQTSQTNQIGLGIASWSVDIPGVLNVSTVSNLTMLTTATSTFNGKLVLPSGSVSGIVNGNNTIDPGTNFYIQLSGATGAFTIASIKGGVDGRRIWLENSTGQTMTIANQSGFDSTTANRILTGYSAGRAFTNHPGIVELRYNGTVSRYEVLPQ